MKPTKRILPLIAIAAILVLACGLSVDGNNGGNSGGLSEDDRVSTNVAATLSANSSSGDGDGGGGDTASATDTAVPEATDTPAPTETSTTSPEPTDDTPWIDVSVDTNCRTGPGQPYDIIGALLVGEKGWVVGVPAVNAPYYIIKNPDGGPNCWVWLEHGYLYGTVTGLPQVAIPPTPTPPFGMVKGRVWHDKCDPLAAGSPPPGCIDPPGGGTYIANGTFDGGENGIQGVTVDIGSGACAGVKTTKTKNDGTFTFEGIAPGQYCVSITYNLNNNLAKLLAGVWSLPYTLNDTTSYNVTVEGGKTVTGILFGWDRD